MSRSRPRQRPGGARKSPRPAISDKRGSRASNSGRDRRRRPGRLQRLFPSAGIAAQFRALHRLLRTTPGLRLYLGCALALWALTRTLVGHGLLTRPHGRALLLLAQVVALVALTLLYFGRTGQLARGRADLRALRAQLATARPWETEAGLPRRVLWRGLARLLWVRCADAKRTRRGPSVPRVAAGELTIAPGRAEQPGEEPC